MMTALTFAAIALLGVFVAALVACVVIMLGDISQ